MCEITCVLILFFRSLFTIRQMFGVQDSWAASKAAKEKDRPPSPRVYVYRGGDSGGKKASPPQQHVCPNGVSIGVGGASQRSPPVSPSGSDRVGQEGNNDIDNRSHNNSNSNAYAASRDRLPSPPAWPQDDLDGRYVVGEWDRGGGGGGGGQHGHHGQLPHYMQGTDASRHHHDGDDPTMKEKHDVELAREREAREHGRHRASPPPDLERGWEQYNGNSGRMPSPPLVYSPSHYHHHHPETNTNNQWDSPTQHQWQDTEPAMSPSFSPTARRAVRFHQHLNHEPGRPAAARRAAPSRPSSAPSNRRAAGGALAPKWETSVAPTGRPEGRPATGAFRAGRVRHAAMDSDFASPGASMRVGVMRCSTGSMAQRQISLRMVAYLRSTGDEIRHRDWMFHRTRFIEVVSLCDTTTHCKRTSLTQSSPVLLLALPPLLYVSSPPPISHVSSEYWSPSHHERQEEQHQRQQRQPRGTTPMGGGIAGRSPRRNDRRRPQSARHHRRTNGSAKQQERGSGVGGSFFLPRS